MKRTLVLTPLTLSLLLLLIVPRAAAQVRGKIVKSGPALPAGNIPPLIHDVAVPVPTVAVNIVATVGGTVVTVKALNGAVTSTQTPALSNQPMYRFIGMTVVGGKLYALTSATAPEQPANRSRLFTITGSNTTLTPVATLSPAGVCGGEGDIAYDKSANMMYATCLDSGGVWRLVTINLGSGAVTPVGPMPVMVGQPPQYAGLAFSPTGELYALDTMNRRLFKLDKQNPANNYSMLTLSAPWQLPNPSATGGLGFNDVGGLYASFGGALVSINTLTGEVAHIGAGAYTALVASGGGLYVAQ
ncbi:MAG: hypothetical protein JOZ02_06100 [Acidobacteria bacterium]|nr:hypothetical protein [Acidobacteriota bacterium]